MYSREERLKAIPKVQLQVEHFGKMAKTSGSIKAVDDLYRKTQPDIMRVFLPDALWRIRSEFCSAGCYVA